jgi:4-coumarate--CoA ligase
LSHTTLGQETLAVIKDRCEKTDDETWAQVLKLFHKDYALGDILSLEQIGLTKFPFNHAGKIMKPNLLKILQQAFANGM